MSTSPQYDQFKAAWLSIINDTKNVPESAMDAAWRLWQVQPAVSERVAELEGAMERIDLKAEAGLCYFTLESARAFLKDIRGIVATTQEQKP